MRKRKLYLSEFIKRYELPLYDDEVQIVGTNYVRNYISMKALKKCIEYDEVKDYEIKSWTYRKSVGYQIIIKGRK